MSAEDSDSDVELEGMDMEGVNSGTELSGNDLMDEDDAGARSPEDQPEEDDAEAAAKRAAAEEAARAAAEEVERIKQEQVERLNSIKVSEAEAEAALDALTPEERRQRRLAYLMAQSEVFAHFLGDSVDDDKKKGKKGKAKAGGGRTRMAEATEDAALMKSSLQARRTTRLLKQPKCIKFGEMRNYQLEGLNWMIKLNENGVNGILADEMGLGKTLQSISMLGYLKEARGISGPHIVITPKSTVSNWIREFNRWCPSLRVLKFLGSKEERKRVVEEQLRPLYADKGQGARGWDVIVTSYEGMLREKGPLTKIKWSYLLIDEAHRIKNEKSSLSKAVREMQTTCRLLITGTPLQNDLHELWALLNFLIPDVFSDSDEFDEWFSMGGDEGRDNVVRKLHTVLRPFMLRRVKNDVAKDLPPKVETKLYIGMSEMQRAWYTKILSKDAHSLNALGGPDRVKLLNVLMQLRKVCNHPYLFEGAEPGPPYSNGPHLWENAGKMVLLNKLLPKLKAQNSRVLIFSQMTRLLDILEDYMLLNGHLYCRIDGSTGGEQRDEAMDAFNAPGSELFVFLLSTRAGGLGINLATADIVILFDSDWNPQVDLQAMDRAHRIGQTKTVRVFRFVTEGTVEEKIIERADRKLFLDAAVIQQGRLAEQNTNLSKNELMSMVRFGADEIFKGQGSVLTDADIDVILANGEARTAEQQELIQKDAQHSLANFSLSTSEEQSGSLFDFEGDDYKKKQAAGGLFLNLPQRERKRNYDVNEYYRSALSGGDGPAPKEKVPKQRKGPAMHDFQFFQKQRLETLLQREHDLNVQAAQAAHRVKDLRHRVGKTESEAEVKGMLEEAEQIEQTLPALQLSEADQALKAKLLEEGFGDWTRKDFRSLCTALEALGRQDKESVTRQVSGETGKAEADVERYLDAFLEKGPEQLAEFPKIIEKIEKGEKKIQRQREISEALSKKMARCGPNPFQALQVNYGGSGHGSGQARGKLWTEDEDAFLVCMMHRHGYGQWERIRHEIRRAWQFKFDWFFKSRNASELARRGDVLLRCIEKENEDADKLQERSQANPEKRKSKGGGDGGKAAGKAAAAEKKRKSASSSPGPSASSPGGGDGEGEDEEAEGKKARADEEDEEDGQGETGGADAL